MTIVQRGLGRHQKGIITVRGTMRRDGPDGLRVDLAYQDSGMRRGYYGASMHHMHDLTL
jgi:hypothetical protein